MTEELDGVPPEELKAELKTAFGDRFPAVLRAIDSALEAEKTVSVSIECKFCRRSGMYPAVVRDTKASLEAAAFLHEKGFGRAGVEQLPGDEDKITFVRVINQSDAARVYESALRFVPEADLDAFHAAAAWTPEKPSLLLDGATGK